MLFTTVYFAATNILVYVQTLISRLRFISTIKNNASTVYISNICLPNRMFNEGLSGIMVNVLFVSVGVVDLIFDEKRKTMKLFNAAFLLITQYQGVRKILFESR